jgi:hypothetical protein
MIVIPELKVAYQNIPKCATTSLFHWFYERLTGAPYSPVDAKPGKGKYLRSHFAKGFDGRVTVEKPGPELRAKLDGYFVFAVTRDPIKRFISMYSNRVQGHRELDQRAKYAPNIRRAGLRFRPPINFLVRHLEDYVAAVKTVRHHSAPMIDFLGSDLTLYGRLVEISELDKLIAELNAHIERAGFRREEPPPALGRKQTKGPKLGLEVLSPASFEKLLERYRADYERIPTVSVEAIRREYEAARAAADAAPKADTPRAGRQGAWRAGREGKGRQGKGRQGAQWRPNAQRRRDGAA